MPMDSHFPVSDNPAQRLFSLLSEARGHTGNDTCMGVWAKIFGFKGDDRVSFFRSIAHLNELADNVEFRIRRLNLNNPELYLRELPVIRQVITPSSVGEGWPSLSQPLRTGALTGLEFCANELKKDVLQPEIAKENLAQIRDQIANLYKLVSEADVDPDFKVVLFDLLTTMQLSIDQYKIRGADGVKRALTYCAGLVKLHESRFKEKKDSPTVKEIIVFVGNLAGVVSAVYKVKQLMGDLGILSLSD